MATAADAAGMPRCKCDAVRKVRFACYVSARIIAATFRVTSGILPSRSAHDSTADKEVAISPSLTP